MLTHKMKVVASSLFLDGHTHAGGDVIEVPTDRALHLAKNGVCAFQSSVAAEALTFLDPGEFDPETNARLFEKYFAQLTK